MFVNFCQEMGGVIQAEIGHVWQCIDGLSEHSQTLSLQLETLTRDGAVAEATGTLKTFTNGPGHSRHTRYLATSSTRAICGGGYPEQRHDCQTVTHTASVRPLSTVYKDLASEEEAHETPRHVGSSPCALRGDATWENRGRGAARGDDSVQMGRGEEAMPEGPGPGPGPGAGAGRGGAGGGAGGRAAIGTAMPWHRHLSLQELCTDSRLPTSPAHSGLFYLHPRSILLPCMDTRSLLTLAHRTVAWERSGKSQNMSDSICAADASPCHHGTPVAYEGRGEGNGCNGCVISWSGLTPWHSNAQTSMPRQSILKRHGRSQQDSVPKQQSDKERASAQGKAGTPENSLRELRQNHGPSEKACASISCALSPLSLSSTNRSTVPSWPSPCTPLTHSAVRDSHTPNTFGATSKSKSSKSESVGPPACDSHLGASFVSVGPEAHFGTHTEVGANSLGATFKSAVLCKSPDFHRSLASAVLGSEGGGNLHLSRSEALANTTIEAYEKGAHWGHGEGWERESMEGAHQGGQGGMVSKEVRSTQGSDPAPTWRVRKGNCEEEGGDQEEGGEEGDSFELTQVQRGLQAARDGHQRLWRAAQRWEQGPFARYGWPHFV